MNIKDFFASDTNKAAILTILSSAISVVSGTVSIEQALNYVVPAILAILIRKNMVKEKPKEKS